jgi:hypothetical protein
MFSGIFRKDLEIHLLRLNLQLLKKKSQIQIAIKTKCGLLGDTNIPIAIKTKCGLYRNSLSDFNRMNLLHLNSRQLNLTRQGCHLN